MFERSHELTQPSIFSILRLVIKYLAFSGFENTPKDVKPLLSQGNEKNKEVMICSHIVVPVRRN